VRSLPVRGEQGGPPPIPWRSGRTVGHGTGRRSSGYGDVTMAGHGPPSAGSQAQSSKHSVAVYVHDRVERGQSPNRGELP